MRLELGDFLRALIAVSQLDEADGVLATWQERADALDRAWTLAILARCRGLLQAAPTSRARLRASSMRSNSTPARRIRFARTHPARARAKERRAKRAAPPARPSASRSPSSSGSTRRSWAEQTRAGCAGSAAAPSRAASCRRVSSVSRPSSPRAGRTRRSRPPSSSPSAPSRAAARVYAKLGVRSRSELTLRLAESGAGSADRTLTEVRPRRAAARGRRGRARGRTRTCPVRLGRLHVLPDVLRELQVLVGGSRAGSARRAPSARPARLEVLLLQRDAHDVALEDVKRVVGQIGRSRLAGPLRDDSA